MKTLSKIYTSIKNKIVKPKRKVKKRSLPDVLTNKEVKILLSSFKIKNRIQYRNKLILELILQTGLKISELINLKWNDINENNGRIHIKQGKNNKDRILFIQPAYFNKLNEFYTKFKITKNIYLFETNKSLKLTQRVLQKNLEYQLKKLNFDKRVYFHLFRHTYLTNLYRQTKDIMQIKQVAGHSNISTTQIYTHIASEQIENAMLFYSSKFLKMDSNDLVSKIN
ncbi:tyrosine-type recombinase/integrase [Candidatus Borrelia fainii]|nr:tyrosine-type recombinase/integrase [Candidatus Borrelia fainii]